MLYLRSPSIARRAFGFSGGNELVRAVPRARFLFFTEFVLSDAGRQMTGNADLNTYNGNRGLSFKIRQIDKPKINLVTSDLNQYNKKKVVYTRVEYPEMNIRLFDTVDNSVLATWIDYFTYYFGDSRVKSDQRAYSQSPNDPIFVDDSGWGLRPLAYNTQFFDRIRVLAFYARTITAFSYINPKITSVDWQAYDYASTDLAEITINFKYEAIKYEVFGAPLTTDNLQRYGWLAQDALDLPGATVQTQAPSYPVPRIFDPNSFNTVENELQLFGTQPPIPTQEDADAIQRYFAAPGATTPTVEAGQFSTVTGQQINYGETSAPAEAIPDPVPQRTTISPFQARQRPRDPRFQTLEERQEAFQARSRQADAVSRQAAIDQGLIPPDSDANVQAIETVGNIPVRVRIDGQVREMELTPDQQARVARYRSMVRSGASIMNVGDL